MKVINNLKFNLDGLADIRQLRRIRKQFPRIQSLKTNLLASQG